MIMLEIFCSTPSALAALVPLPVGRMREIEGYLIAAEEVTGVDFALDIVEDGVVAVGNDGLGLQFESLEVVDDLATEEGGTVG